MEASSQRVNSASWRETRNIGSTKPVIRSHLRPMGAGAQVLHQSARYQHDSSAAGERAVPQDGSTQGGSHVVAGGHSPVPGISTALRLSTAIIFSLDHCQTRKSSAESFARDSALPSETRENFAISESLCDKLHAAIERAINGAIDQERTLASAIEPTAAAAAATIEPTAAATSKCAPVGDKKRAYDTDSDEPQPCSGEKRGRSVAFDDDESRPHDRLGKLSGFERVVSQTTAARFEENASGRHGGASRNR